MSSTIVPAVIESLESRTLLSDTAAGFTDVVADPADSIIRGRVFDDLNNNRRLDPGEKLLAGVKVRVFQTDFGGFNHPITTGPIFPPRAGPGQPATSDDQGSFMIDHLSRHIYGIRVTASPMHIDSYNVLVNLGASEDKTVDIPVRVFNVIRGRVLPYLKKDSYIVRKLPIYLDRNNNGKLDEDEPTTFNRYDGTYRFDHVSDGPYVVRVITDRPVMHEPSGVAARDTFATDDIVIDHRMAFVRLRAYLDRNRNGMRDLGEPMIRRAVLDVDTNQNGRLNKGELLSDQQLIGPNGFYVYFGKTRITIRNSKDSEEKFSRSITLNIKDFKPIKHHLVAVQPL